MFAGLGRAWFAPCVTDRRTLALWKEHGGRVSKDGSDATVFFSDSAKDASTARVLEEPSVFVYDPLYVRESCDAGALLQLAQYILPPVDIGQGNYASFHTQKQRKERLRIDKKRPGPNSAFFKKSKLLPGASAAGAVVDDLQAAGEDGQEEKKRKKQKKDEGEGSSVFGSLKGVPAHKRNICFNHKLTRLAPVNLLTAREERIPRTAYMVVPEDLQFPSASSRAGADTPFERAKKRELIVRELEKMSEAVPALSIKGLKPLDESVKQIFGIDWLPGPPKEQDEEKGEKEEKGGATTKGKTTKGKTTKGKTTKNKNKNKKKRRPLRIESREDAARMGVMLPSNTKLPWRTKKQRTAAKTKTTKTKRTRRGKQKNKASSDEEEEEEDDEDSDALLNKEIDFEAPKKKKRRTDQDEDEEEEDQEGDDEDRLSPSQVLVNPSRRGRRNQPRSVTETTPRQRATRSSNLRKSPAARKLKLPSRPAAPEDEEDDDDADDEAEASISNLLKRPTPQGMHDFPLAAVQGKVDALVGAGRPSTRAVAKQSQAAAGISKSQLNNLVKVIDEFSSVDGDEDDEISVSEEDGA